jgi:hypothetical protein
MLRLLFDELPKHLDSSFEAYPTNLARISLNKKFKFNLFTIFQIKYHENLPNAHIPEFSLVYLCKKKR